MIPEGKKDCRTYALEYMLVGMIGERGSHSLTAAFTVGLATAQETEISLSNTENSDSSSFGSYEALVPSTLSMRDSSEPNSLGSKEASE